MSLFEPAPQPWPDRMLAIFRIVAGLIFITAGTTKLFGFPPIPVPTPPLVLMSQIGIGAIMELVGGVLIVLGLFTRPTSFLLAGEMAVAYWQFHAPGSIWPTVNQGIAAIMYCFLFLYLMVAGAGAWSIDAAIARSRRHRVAANGFTLIELMIPIVIIAIIAAIAIPNTENARMGGNESSAIGSMQSIFAGQILFQARHERFAASLPELAEGDRPLIGANLADGENGGYHFETELTSTGFRAHAHPAMLCVTGRRFFYIDETGVLSMRACGADGPDDDPGPPFSMAVWPPESENCSCPREGDVARPIITQLRLLAPVDVVREAAQWSASSKNVERTLLAL